MTIHSLLKCFIFFTSVELMLAVRAMASLFNLDETREPIVWYMKPLAKCWDVLIDWFSFKKIRSANWKKSMSFIQRMH